jgi:hypothetical protein
MAETLFKQFKLKKQTRQVSDPAQPDDPKAKIEKVYYEPTSRMESALSKWLGIEKYSHNGNRPPPSPQTVDLIRGEAKKRGKFALTYVDRLISAAQQHPTDLYHHMPEFTREEVIDFGLTKDDLTTDY